MSSEGCPRHRRARAAADTFVTNGTVAAIASCFGLVEWPQMAGLVLERLRRCAPRAQCPRGSWASATERSSDHERARDEHVRRVAGRRTARVRGLQNWQPIPGRSRTA